MKEETQMAIEERMKKRQSGEVKVAKKNTEFEDLVSKKKVYIEKMTFQEEERIKTNTARKEREDNPDELPNEEIVNIEITGSVEPNATQEL